MGKVLNAFLRGWPGTVSRSLDTVIISVPNKSGGDIPFGAPVFNKSDATGAELWNTTTNQDMTKFIGFAVRSASKTPDTYGSSEGVYKNNEMMDVLVRGSLSVNANGTPKFGGKVYIVNSTGKLSASAGSSGSTTELTNCKWRGAADSNYHAELVVTERNIQ